MTEAQIVAARGDLHAAQNLQRLIDQLQYAVNRFGGKTTITEADLSVLRQTYIRFIDRIEDAIE